MNSNKIGAIVVLYNPDLEVTLPALNALSPQVDEICIVDNTPGGDFLKELSQIHNLKYIVLGENRGIAAAQNIGIKYFINNKYDFVIFSDQDSIAPKGTVSNLLGTYLSIEKSGTKVGVVGPLPIFRNTDKFAIEKQNILKYEEISPTGKPLYYMNSVLSSFSLIRLNLFGEIGMYDEALFIDGVDSEWCWRAYSLYGYYSVLDTSVKISHCLGESSQGPAKIFVPSPFRTYYQFRNFFKLIRRSYTPRWWIYKNGLKYVIKYFYYPLFLSNKLDYLRNMTRGIRDGILNR